MADHPTDDPTAPESPVTESPAAPRTFATFEEVPGMQPCVKKPLIVHACRMQAPFRVESLEGNFKLGKPGDLLMRGIDGELYICDADVFERSYDWVEDGAAVTQR